MEQRSLNENHLLVPFSVAEGHFTSWFCGNANSIHINKGGCTMDIGGVLSRAWQIIWRHKVLWIFLGTIGRIGLIRGTQQVEQGADRLGFGDLFRDSLPFFWRVFGLNLLFGIAAFILFLILLVPFIFLAVVTLGLGVLCIIPIICILVPLAWLAQVVITQASIAMVVEDVGIRAGLQRGWDLFRANLGTIIVMALILILGVGLIGGTIVALPLVVVVVPAIIGAAAGTDQALRGGLLTAGLCFLAYLPVLLVLSGILRAYIESAWTLTYMRLTNKPVAPPLEPITV